MRIFSTHPGFSPTHSEGKVRYRCSGTFAFYTSIGSSRLSMLLYQSSTFITILCIYPSVNIMDFQTLRSLIMRSKSVCVCHLTVLVGFHG
ncbi:hypothetical protein VNO78_27195 [Psophocarpus tetragonolobus]|uniref:Uncharacterized protein n=1 Tax=Psophocarpus tetragonolobus TaxID=3891 RepID=A0AAN9S0W9_PSOTE